MNLAGFEVGLECPMFVIAGPCVIESQALVLEVAEALAGIGERTGIPLIFKASFDKANRSSGSSFRGPGLQQGLAALERVRSATGLPVLTDVHEDTPMDEVASVVDVIQTPAFLCRQTDLLIAAARTGQAVNVKKGQFLSPAEMQHVVTKLTEAGEDRAALLEVRHEPALGDLDCHPGCGQAVTFE